MQYRFHFGASPNLAKFEFQRLVEKEKILKLSPEFAIAEFLSDSEAKILLQIAGSIVSLEKRVENKWELVSRHSWRHWIKRDRNKPYADHKKGMLPPKLARTLVNIGLSYLEITDDKLRLYDPFCGTGTVLMEALLLGCEVVGSDLQTEAIVGSKTNLDWLCKEYKLEKDFSVFQSESTKAQPKKKANLIVTEPFLGKQTPQAREYANIYKGLYKLYLGSFKHWTKLLKNNAVVVIIFPVFSKSKKAAPWQKLIDKLSVLGYTSLSEPVGYARPQAVVKRSIHCFRYNVKS